MAQTLKQLHRGASTPPQFLFSVPHYTGKQTVSGAEIVERDWFVEEAAGVKEPEHPGETMAEYRERKANHMKVYKALALGFAVLLAVGLCVGLVLL